MKSAWNVVLSSRGYIIRQGWGDVCAKVAAPSIEGVHGIYTSLAPCKPDVVVHACV